MSNDDVKPNWILFQTKYDWMALPVEVGVEVMKHMRCMNHDSGKVFVLSDADITVRMLNADAMTVAVAKSKMVPKD